MDINKMIAEASAPHMQRIGTALDELRAACTAATAAGFRVSLRIETGESEATDAVISNRIVAFLIAASPGLEYTASVRERDPA